MALNLAGNVNYITLINSHYAVVMETGSQPAFCNNVRYKVTRRTLHKIRVGSFTRQTQFGTVVDKKNDLRASFTIEIPIPTGARSV